MILSRDIDDQRILQSDWMRVTHGHIQQKGIVMYSTFPWLQSPCKKSKISPDSFQGYSRSIPHMIRWEHFRLRLKNQIFLRQVVFAKPWSTLLFMIFKERKTHQWIKFLVNAKKPYFGGIFGPFFPKWEFFWKIRLCQFFTLPS